MSTVPAENSPIQAVPIGEQDLRAASLVEQARIATELELSDYFLQPDSPDSFRLNDIANLLHSPKRPLVFALEDLGLVHDWGHEIPTQRLEKKKFDRQAVLELNKHELVRTVASPDLALELGIPSAELTALVQKAGIKPVRPFNRQPHRGYFDLDQVELLKRAAAGENVYVDADELLPADKYSNTAEQNNALIPASQLVEKLGALGLSVSRLIVIEKLLGLTPHIDKKPEDIEGESYYTEEEAALILAAIRNNIARKKGTKTKH